MTVGYPDRAGREAILRIHTRGIPLAPDVDLANVARQTAGFAGADLANLANEAALLAARKGRETVGLAEFEESLDKVLLGHRQPALTHPEERRVVAYHEGRPRARRAADARGPTRSRRSRSSRTAARSA